MLSQICVSWNVIPVFPITKLSLLLPQLLVSETRPQIQPVSLSSKEVREKIGIDYVRKFDIKYQTVAQNEFMYHEPKHIDIKILYRNLCHVLRCKTTKLTCVKFFKGIDGRLILFFTFNQHCLLHCQLCEELFHLPKKSNIAQGEKNHI